MDNVIKFAKSLCHIKRQCRGSRDSDPDAPGGHCSAGSAGLKGPSGLASAPLPQQHQLLTFSPAQTCQGPASSGMLSLSLHRVPQSGDLRVTPRGTSLPALSRCSASVPLACSIGIPGQFWPHHGRVTSQTSTCPGGTCPRPCRKEQVR